MKSLFIIFVILSFVSRAQLVPSSGENLDFLITAGMNCKGVVGDDDHQQTIFFLVPTTYKNAFYIRVFDPEISGSFDERIGSFDTETTFSLYGGKGVHSDEKAKSIAFEKEVKGIKIESKTFGGKSTYDNGWYTFGPINPKEGELDPNFKGYVFKMVVTAGNGNDVNLYKIALSSSKNSNLAIPSGNIFTYEYSIRLKTKRSSVAHLYPYISKDVISIKQYNFDFDNDGKIMLFSSVKKGDKAKVSGNGNWSMSKHQISEKEIGKCIDYQIIKKSAWHNDMVVYIVNQYNKPVPFFAVPLGGVPEQDFKIKGIK